MRKAKRYGWLAVVVITAALSPWAFGVGTKFWSSATYEEFSTGTFNGVSLNREGTMSLAPQLKEMFSTDQAVIWAVVRDGKGNTYLGTGHGGKVFKLTPDLKGTVFFDAPEPDVFALAVDKDNRVYVATSPEGKIYRVDQSGKSEEFFDPQSRYIWAMSFSSDGSLYVGTGDRGKIFKVSPSGKGDLFYDTKQTHVMTLATTPANDLIAGSEPNGLIYRVSPAGKAFVLYDAPLSEIHRVAVAPDGNIYAAALGSSDDRRMRNPQRSSPDREQPLQASTTITVRASEGPSAIPGQGMSTSSPEAEQPKKEASIVEPEIPNLPPSYAAGAPRGEGRGTKSALYRISPDGSVDTLWNSPKENVFDLLPSGNRLLFSTDDKGRIYELTPDRRASMVTETDEEETTRLIPFQNFVLATTANLGKVYRVGTQPADTGSYESVVKDTGGISSWGKIRWRADSPSGTAVEFFTRSGNSGRPDATWSDWTGPYKQQNGDQVTSPPARYVQWKAVLHAADQHSPVLQEVVLPYLPKNQAPTVTELKVAARGEKPAGATPSVGTTVNFRGASGYATTLRPTPQKGYDVSWQANDPDQDELTYALYFRGEGEAEWKLLQDDLKQNYFQLETDALPDGKYRLRVVASDGSVNPAGMAKTAEMISAPFVIDNAPPEVEAKDVKRGNGVATAKFRAVDRTSGLTKAEYVLDAEPPVPILSDDGIVDSQEEYFTVNLNKLDGREHLLTLRVYDSAGNMGVGKALWSSTGGEAK